MNTPSPLIPQGTFPGSRGKSHIRIAVLSILAIHAVVLIAFLMAGCKQTTDNAGGTDNAGNTSTGISNPPARPDPSSVLGSFETNPPTPTNPSITSVTTNPPSVTPTNLPNVVDNKIEPSGVTEHTVVKNDSFFALAKKYHVTMKAIQDANPGVDSTKLKLGQKLKIPAAVPQNAGNGHVVQNGGSGGETVYAVKSGDRLLTIAKAHGISVKELKAANNLKTDRITVGQKLKIPSKSTTPPAPETPPGTPGATP